jgi:hypothetical protein
MGVSKIYALASFALSLYNCCLLNLGHISAGAIFSNAQTCSVPSSGFFSSINFCKSVRHYWNIFFNVKRILFGAGLLKMTFGTQYLVYALDYDEPLFAKGKWPAKRPLFGKKIVLNYEDN